jgi:LmbE family N-acetylglucosaminyl deacetylase
MRSSSSFLMSADRPVFPDGKVVVVSPHLDDAVFSLGGALADLGRARTVSVITLFAGDPGLEGLPTAWDARAGFDSAPRALTARREEDRRACERLGVEAQWLAFDNRYPEGAAEALHEALEGADVVLVPGFPCTHRDHVLVARAVLEQRARIRSIGLYVDQPYAMWRLLGREAGREQRLRNAGNMALRRATKPLLQPQLSQHLVDLVDAPAWLRLPPSRRAWFAKQRAIRAYASQLRSFSREMPFGIALYEWAWGGEALAWV